MISLILLGCEVSTAGAPTPNAGLLRERVVRSLASLVEGSVAGVIADAALVGPTDVGLGDIADEAGCHVYEAADPAEAFARAVRQARQADVFVLCAGFATDRAFIEEARDVAAFGGLAQARALRAAPDSLLTRLSPGLARVVGLLARRDAIGASQSADVGRLARQLRARELMVRARKTSDRT
jgi:hypothetical protein